MISEASPSSRPPRGALASRLGESLRGLGWDGWVWLAALVALSCLAYHFSTKNVDLRIAWLGWSPLDYVAHKLMPENFNRDWPNGIKDMHYLWPMRVYYYLAKYLDISPMSTLFPFMAVQSLCFVGAIAHLTQVLFRDRLASLAAACLTLICGLVGLNLARFGEGFGTPSMNYAAPWGFALALIALALAAHFRGRIVWSFVYLALAMYCHAGFGLYALGFIGCWYLIHPRLMFGKDFLVGLGIFIILMIPLFLPLVQAAGTTSGISKERWLILTKVFSFHSYPYSMQMFGARAFAELTPLALFAALSFFLVSILDNPAHRAKIWWGFLGCLLASVAGVVFSDFYPVVAIIKLQPHRASALITFVGGILLSGYLARLVRAGDPGIILSAGLIWVLLMITKPGLPIVPILILLALDYRQGLALFKNWRPESKVRTGLGMIVLLCLGLGVVTDLFFMPLFESDNLSAHWLQTWLMGPTRQANLPLLGGYPTLAEPLAVVLAFGLLVSLALTVGRIVGDSAQRYLVPVMAGCLLLLFPYVVLDQRALAWEKGEGVAAREYLEVQLWAKESTSRDSLFMTDPSHAYGWRDFSQRSSFGTGIEWGFNALFYSSTPQRLEEGLRRLSRLGADLSPHTSFNLNQFEGANFWGSILNSTIKKRFEALTSTELRDLAKEFGLDYVVFNRTSMARSHEDLEVAFQNDAFIVYSLVR